MTVASLLQAIAGDPVYSRQIATIREFPQKNAEYGDSPVSPSLAAYLSHKGIPLYSHQAAAIDAAGRGENVILTTSTASGKTLAFLLPVFEKLEQDPAATALIIYPTKALANDQLKAVVELERETEIRVSPAIYDGDTPGDRRPGIRKSSRIILTNPYELHHILPWHYQWSSFLKGLSFIVIDETHRYRGVQGSHMAFLLRRFRRLCQHYGSDPVYFLSSATLAIRLSLPGGSAGSPSPLLQGTDHHGDPGSLPDQPSRRREQAIICPQRGRSPDRRMHRSPPPGPCIYRVPEDGRTGRPLGQGGAGTEKERTAGSPLLLPGRISP